jgi:serine/threonine-protein kinase HipA
MTLRTLNVWWNMRLAGHLTQDRHGDIGFTYSPEWLADSSTQALSASLPKRPQHFSRRECRPFFAGLLPEERQREAAAQALGVSSANDFALLDRLGGDVAGALQLLPIGDRPIHNDLQGRNTPLDDEGIIRVLDALPIRPLLAGEEGLRLSLAGAQAKVPVVLVDRAIALPMPGQPTTHILKPPIARFNATTENEALVMKLAAAIGLDVAPVDLRTIRERTFLLVKRYDRITESDGAVQRVHQEDFCQALGVPPEIKHASEGGPTLKDCFELLRKITSRPAVDVLKLLDAVIFNAIVGNADAHGKKFSVLYEETGPRLAPLYDLLSTVAYPDLSSKFAMKIGKKSTIEELDAKEWEAFAKECGLGFPLVRRRLSQMIEQVKSGIKKVAEELALPGLDCNATKVFSEIIQKRAEQSMTTAISR